MRSSYLRNFSSFEPSKAPPKDKQDFNSFWKASSYVIFLLQRKFLLFGDSPIYKLYATTYPPTHNQSTSNYKNNKIRPSVFPTLFLTKIAQYQSWKANIYPTLPGNDLQQPEFTSWVLTIRSLPFVVSSYCKTLYNWYQIPGV